VAGAAAGRLRYFQVATKEAAEDLAADTWTAVIGRLGRFRADERAFRAWIFTVAPHRAIDWHRQAARRPTDSVPAERLSERRAPDDPASRWWTASRPGRRRPWWPELPVDQAEVVALRVLGGPGVAEVAGLLGGVTR
jgi:RNA polymerase sigma-70 factor, ECF subfamily